MQTVQVNQQQQVIIPPKIIQQLNYHVNDVLEVQLIDNTIKLIPKVVVDDKEERFQALMQYAGIGLAMYDPKNPNATVDEIREDRDSWRF